MHFTIPVRAAKSETVTRFLVALLLGISLLILSGIQFDVGIEGPIVDTYPLFWVFIAISLAYAIANRNRYLYSSLTILFFIGLSLRLIVALHSLYPGVDPWNELASVHHIQATGFDLKGNYYHSSMPVLQTLLILSIPVFGQYNTITFFGPIFGWILAFVCLYKLAREFFSTENTILVLLLYSCANIGFQCLTTPESIALGVGFATIFFFHRNLVKPSLKYVFATIGMFILLIFTHHLTAFCVLLTTGGVMILLSVQKGKKANLYVWFGMLLSFLLYYQTYQGMLSNLLFFRLENPMIGVPTGWPKPLWWWVIYILPNALLFLMLTIWIIPFIRKKKTPTPFEIFAMILAGAFSLLFGFLAPQSLPPLRLLNQFGGYFLMGAASLSAFASVKRLNILITILCTALLLGLVTAFPMTNGNDFYLGGYWTSHSPEEMSALQYLAANAIPTSTTVIDGRCRRILEAFASPSRNLNTLANQKAFEIYNSTSPEQAWIYCTQNNVSYVFVSLFYHVIAQFDVYTTAARFSQGQLSKFNSPYFSLFYASNDSEVSIYSVNTQP